VTVHLVRHAKAGSRKDWHGDDLLRPLSKNGRAQARAIADALAPRDVTALVSSPFVRCRQTLEPLGEQVGLPVVDDERLGEGNPFEKVLVLLEEVPDGAVLCTHGDIVPDAIAALQRRGCDVRGTPDWRKGTVWLLERDGAGAFTSASVWPPPS
jgi:8-oxo-dGTP diphosphatase